MKTALSAFAISLCLIGLGMGVGMSFELHGHKKIAQEVIKIKPSSSVTKLSQKSGTQQETPYHNDVQGKTEKLDSDANKQSQVDNVEAILIPAVEVSEPVVIDEDSLEIDSSDWNVLVVEVDELEIDTSEIPR